MFELTLWALLGASLAACGVCLKMRLGGSAASFFVVAVMFVLLIVHFAV